jgi:1-acyl-sn-glycerol-3-phosphate acyltransferase/nucleoside-diphosphate-sugar epimerase
MAKITLIAGRDNALAKALLDCFRHAEGHHEVSAADPNLLNREDVVGAEALVYVPSVCARDGMTPDLREAEDVFRSAASSANRCFVLLSSAMVYGIGPGRQALVDESYSAPGICGRIADRWQCLEAQAARHFSGRALVILRLSLASRFLGMQAKLLQRRLVATLLGHDPVLQVLGTSDLARAVLGVISGKRTGVFNVAPDLVIPLRRAIGYAGGMRVPVPCTLQRLARSSESLDYVRYPWTISNQKIKRETGFAPRQSSLAALKEFRDGGAGIPDPEPVFDEFGLDEKYIQRLSKTAFRFLSDFYWRIENKGMEYIPRAGRGILVGMHRGFMPLDGAMAVHTIVRETGRFPRFLTHPLLFKFPFLFDFMTKMGGVCACRESAARVLENDGLLGVFPEGVQGAFTLYRNAYKIQGFGRDAFVKLALRYRAPIIPFVTVGSAEIFPVFAAIRFPWFKRYAGFPYIPITPTFPLLPLPLPSKWHTQFLPPVDIAKYPPEAADDPSIVKAISLEVRTRMQGAVDEMRRRRKSIFFGSIFEPSRDESRSKPAVV